MRGSPVNAYPACAVTPSRKELTFSAGSPLHLWPLLPSNSLESFQHNIDIHQQSSVLLRHSKTSCSLFCSSKAAWRWDTLPGISRFCPNSNAFQALQIWTLFFSEPGIGRNIPSWLRIEGTNLSCHAQEMNQTMKLKHKKEEVTGWSLLSQLGISS